MKRHKRRRPSKSEWAKLSKVFCMAVVKAENFLHKYFHYRKKVSTSGRFLSCEGRRVRIRKSGIPATDFTFTVWAWADPRNAPKSFKIPAAAKYFPVNSQRESILLLPTYTTTQTTKAEK